MCAIPSRFARLILSRMGRIIPPHLLDPKDTPAELFTSAITAATKEVFGIFAVCSGGMRRLLLHHAAGLNLITVDHNLRSGQDHELKRC